MHEQSSKITTLPIIARAAGLLLKCAGFMDDSEAAVREDDRHCDTYYAIDTDVIILYLNPESRVVYLDVFGEGAKSPTPRLLAFMIGDFLFKSSEPFVPGHKKQKCRFLIVPPHDEELLRVLSAIHRQLSRVTDTIDMAMFNELSAVFEHYEKSGDNQALLNSLRTHVPDLVELFNPYRGPKAALTRYALLPETTFQRIETYLEDDFTFPLLDPISESKDREKADQLIEQWERLLKKSKMRVIQPAHAIRRDAEVLATIEYVNSNLYDVKKQLVLVTGSSYLFDAANKYFPLSTTNRSTSERSFADMYLRHPQAFLAHPEVFSLLDPENAPFKVVDWLNLFFPSDLYPAIQPHGLVRRESLRNIAKGRNRSFNHVIDVLSSPEKGIRPIELLIEEWQTQVASVAKARYADGLERADERGAIELANKLNELRQTSRWSLEILRTLMSRESLGSISILYSTTVWVGLWGSIARVQSKGIPALRFDSEYENIRHYCEEVIRLQMKAVNRSVLLAELKELKALSEKATAADPSLYHIHIIYALAFAVKGHWYATLTLARIAMAICDSMDLAVRGVRSGREAAYLACIAIRRSAKNRSDLSEAARYLDEAIRRENRVVAEDIRFAAERLALATRTYYFALFCDHKSPEIQAVTTTLDGLNQLVDAAQTEENQLVKHWVLCQTLTNYFTLLLIARDLQWSDNVSNDETIRKNLMVFQTVLENVEAYSHKRENDPYAHLIFDISTAIWAPNQEKRELAKNNVRNAINTWGSFFMPYDKDRFDLLSRSLPDQK